MPNDKERGVAGEILSGGGSLKDRIAKRMKPEDEQAESEQDSKPASPQASETDSRQDSKIASEPSREQASTLARKERTPKRERVPLGTYIYADLQRALDLYCVLYEVQKWEVISEALEKYLPDTVKKM